ncbi:caspase recruitment domain-containing protein 19 isoform X5 [Gorilla gorilla gorilla]|uniref:caspase recruitment domain-containing protein 19 isoform X5 n=1 Tax=Gorilla gorilla gorilla TaxID=9595 RepID=UPI0024456AF9|nr:caspase recruitment domain-containing protein 19 isoform X10 [Gorilla gorilla gorilla]
MTDQTYCDRLVQDTPFLTGHGRLSEQQVDRIILQLNRYYPQILTNKEAEKVLRRTHELPGWPGPCCGTGPAPVLLSARPQGPARDPARPRFLTCHHRQTCQPLPAGLPGR